MWGSSPRVRGKRPGLLWRRAHRGLIPARAGKTPGCDAEHAFLTAHPRACGENPSPSFARASSHGSSPRVRGKRDARMRACHRCGLIPARAGKTSPEQRPQGTTRAHPRACGENRAVSTKSASADGSSPRVRGKLCPGYHVLIEHGLIPARAGKTCGGSSSPSWTWAHPRACGENHVDTPQPMPICGSSPRVRGKLVHAAFGDHAVGLIPARAGKTATFPFSASPAWAHPRACGENK